MSYSVQADVNSLFGEENVNRWGAVNTADDASDIATNVTNAITWADAAINGLFTDGPYPTPFSPVPTLVGHWSATLAGVYLYRKRGLQDEGDDVAGKLTALEKDVKREMGWYVSGSRRLQTVTSHDNGTAPYVVR